MLVTFRNARWLGYVHAPGTPICIEGSRIKAVSVQEQSDVVVNLDDSIIIVTCETRAAAVSEQARIVRAVNREPEPEASKRSPDAGESTGDNFELSIGASMSGSVVIGVEFSRDGKPEVMSRRVDIQQALAIKRKMSSAIMAAEELKAKNHFH